ncbi:MAG: carbohydrate ABC transporter permease [Eubacteriales bacterium]
MKKTIEKKIPYIILSCMAVIFLLPILWVVLASFDITASSSVKIPENWTLDNYKAIWSEKSNIKAFGNGLFISFAQSFLVVIVAGLAAYPISRYEMKYKNIFMYTILLMTALPITAVMIPVYKMFLAMKLYDQLLGVILFLTATSLPYGIFLTKNFMDGVPIELEEAAKVDGATVITCITKIILPLMFPGVCVVFIYTFSASWGNFFVPYILLQSIEKLPASVTLYQFFGQHGMVIYGQLAAYSALYAIPSIVLYILAQNYMSKGFNMEGAAKG